MSWFLASLVVGVVAVLAGATLGRARVPAVVALLWVEAVLAAVAAGRVLASGHPLVGATSALIPFGGAVIDLTALGALVVLVTVVVTLAATLYWLGYAHHSMTSRSATSATALFVGAMLVVPAAGSTATFLLAWELMALGSLVLVAHDHARSPSARAATLWYAASTQGGAAAILLALVLLGAHASSSTFASLTVAATHLSGATRALVFLAALAGFASKAGAVPLHVWLPRAHAEAPGPASALMSGAMVNLGIYGVALVGLRLLGGGPAWWWLVVVALGVVSALYGALYAATTTDLKRLLAYSTSDNMGLVLIALGLAGLAHAHHHPALAALALVSALTLMVNHSLFKGLLFLTAGSVLDATGTRDLDRLGGLARTTPVTAALFLVGAGAVMALPPLNGFIGEWLLFQSLAHAASAAPPLVVAAVVAGVAALALTGGLSVVAFVKAAGIGLLGRARSPEAAAAREVPRPMRLGPGLLAALCVVLGVVPGVVLPTIERAGVGVVPGATPLRGGAGLVLARLSGAVDPVLIASALALALVLTVGLVRGRAPRASRAAEPWGSGRMVQTPRMQYSATAFAEPLRRVFDDVLRPESDLEVTPARESRYYIERVRYAAHADDVIERVAYRPLRAALTWWGERARALANGSVHRYLAYGLVTLVVVLVVLA